jgi:hypothetical protein
MRIQRICYLILVLHLPLFNSTAATLTSNGTGGGNWGNAASWDGSNTPDDMADGDTLVIQLGDTITITSNVTFNGVIQIYGVLVFDVGKLNMDANSSIQLAAGSDIISLSSGQNDQIRIGDANNKISTDEINNLTTPNQLTEGSLTSGGCAVTGDCEDDPLPVKVIYFYAAKQEKSVILHWTTAMEENLNYFTLERSSDGLSFYDFATLFSKTEFSTSMKKYQFIDEMPLGGLSYYRLKAIDFNGSFEYHGIVAVNRENSNPDILLYPNPVFADQINVSFSGENIKSFTVYKITGEIIEQGMLKPGINKINFNKALNNGIYFIQVETATRISKKIIVK